MTATKDTVVVTAAGGGAECIPVLKGGVVLILAFAAMLLYSKLSNKLSRTNLFYTIVISFAVFFFLYGFILFPHRDFFSLNTSANWLLSIVGDGHKHWIAVYRYWMNSLFFVLAELWGGIMISLLFWGFANQITNVKDAARFYVLYTAGGQVGTMVAGILIYYFAGTSPGNFAPTIAILMSITLLICAIIIAVYWWTNRYVVNGPKFKLTIPNKQHLKSKTKLSLRASLAFIMRSPYLGLIAMMVIGYGVSINMVEVSWKAMLKVQAPTPEAYQSCMGLIQTILGTISLFVALFVGGNIIRRYGWYASAQLTPILLGCTSLLFFICCFIFPDYAANKNILFTLLIPHLSIDVNNSFFYITTTQYLITPLALIILLGAIHNITCKTMKYCLFDTTKEMAYIPLDHETKIKGKAAVDLVGARFGKSGSSWTQLALIDLLSAGSILEVLPLLFPCVAFIVLFWIFAVKNLNKRFVRLQVKETVSAH